jgi:hypothetical protein
MTIDQVEKEYQEAMQSGVYTFAETLLAVAIRQAKEAEKEEDTNDTSE